MGTTRYYIDKADPASIENLLDDLNIRGTEHERTIQAVLALHTRPFTLQLRVDYLNPIQFSPLHDAFTFDIETDELIVFTDSPAALIDALLEMAMFMAGFNTLLGVQDDWKIQVTIGAWRYVRESIKAQIGIAGWVGKLYSASLEAEPVTQFDRASFAAMVMLAGCPALEVTFPEGTNDQVVTTYRRLCQIMKEIAHEIDLTDYLTFNRRLHRALFWIEDTLLPKADSPFDDLFGPGGFSDHLFDDEADDPR
jgi:hypothetical protein